jgi:hypothetical protein
MKYAKLWKELARKMRGYALELANINHAAMLYCQAQHDDVQRLLKTLNDLSVQTKDPETAKQARAAILASFPPETGARKE